MEYYYSTGQLQVWIWHQWLWIQLQRSKKGKLEHGIEEMLLHYVYSSFIVEVLLLEGKKKGEIQHEVKWRK